MGVYVGGDIRLWLSMIGARNSKKGRQNGTDERSCEFAALLLLRAGVEGARSDQ